MAFFLSFLLQSHSIHGMTEEEAGIRPYKEMGILTYEEKKFLLAVERGDVASTRRQDTFLLYYSEYTTMQPMMIIHTSVPKMNTLLIHGSTYMHYCGCIFTLFVEIKSEIQSTLIQGVFTCSLLASIEPMFHLQVQYPRVLSQYL